MTLSPFHGFFQVIPTERAYCKCIPTHPSKSLITREGATPKAIEERIAKLKREAKALDGPGTSGRAVIASLTGKKRKGSMKSMETDDDEEEPNKKKNIREE